MDGDSNERGGTRLSPDEAFAAVGHETRAGIIDALATTDRADRPLRFSELRARVGTADSAQFNYHLDQLVGHFLERTDAGYDLRRAGGRVAEAILSGAVTDDPVIERTRIDQSCHHCGAPMAVDYRQERIGAYCTACAGTYGDSNRTADADGADEYGFLGYLNIPPAGIADRSPGEVHRAALSWQLSEQLLAANGTCPRCSAPLDERLELCEDHPATDGSCPNCERRYAAQHSASCTNCVHAQRVTFGLSLLDATELQAFLTGRDIDIVAPDHDAFASVLMNYDEEIRGTEPFEAAFTFTADGDAIRLTVDEAFDVVDATTHLDAEQ